MYDISFDNIIQSIVQEYCELSDNAIADWQHRCSLKAISKGTKLTTAGSHCDKLWYIVRGGVKAYYLKDGKSISDWFAFEGSFMCAINSYFLEIPNTHFIETLEDSVLLETKRADILELCQQHHDFEHLGSVSVTRTMLQLQQRIVSLQFETAQERYQHLLDRFPDIELRVPLQDIASFLGITPETLSRLRSNATS
ncbi:MAG: Crp/Fnr family transcriptional regulator [Cyclobacteriaceae bacterium]